MTARPHGVGPARSWSELHAALRRPLPFQASDAPFWNDDYIAGRLLIAHLDQSDDAASRPSSDLDRCVAALDRHGLTGSGRRVLDLGCGPGLIAERLAVAGAAVTGIDVSTSSLTHARESAERRGLAIDYRRQDFREVADDAAFDLVLQSYGEFGTLDAATLDAVLATIRRALRPGGALVFDVTTPAAPAPRPGNRWALTQGGLWRPGEYVLLTDHLDYPENLGCDRYVVIDDDVTTYRMWKRAYTPATIRESLTRAGFVVERLWSTLAGDAYVDGSPWLAVVARVPS